MALALADAGAAVAVNYVVGEDEAQAVVDSITSAGGRAIALRADASNEEEVETMFAQAVAAFGTWASSSPMPGSRQPRRGAAAGGRNTVINVNLTGQILCARRRCASFCGADPSDVSRALGKIICMSSVHEVIPWAGHANYAASKGGVTMLRKTIAQELAPRGIRVNGLAPGATRTPINTAAWSTPEARTR